MPGATPRTGRARAFFEERAQHPFVVLRERASFDASGWDDERVRW